MKIVHKFTLNIGDTFFQIPPLAKAISVGEQLGELQMWVELDPTELPTQRKFSVFGTGSHISDQLTHVGTAIMQGGHFVAHVYESK